MVTISGVTWNPQVFEVHEQVFHDAADERVGVLVEPFDIRFKEGRSRTAPRFPGFAWKTSDEFVNDLCQEFSLMVLQELQHLVLCDDETIYSSRVEAVHEIGLLFEPGMMQPMLTKEMKEERQLKKATKPTITSGRDRRPTVVSRRPRRVTW